MEHEQAAEVRSRSGLTGAKTPKETADGRCQKLCPHTTAYEKSGHCRIEETGEEGTDRGDESEGDTENTKRKRK